VHSADAASTLDERKSLDLFLPSSLSPSFLRPRPRKRKRKPKEKNSTHALSSVLPVLPPLILLAPAPTFNPRVKPMLREIPSPDPGPGRCARSPTPSQAPPPPPPPEREDIGDGARAPVCAHPFNFVSALVWPPRAGERHPPCLVRRRKRVPRLEGDHPVVVWVDSVELKSVHVYIKAILERVPTVHRRLFFIPTFKTLREGRVLPFEAPSS
jgi:hypothetical protein